MADPPQEEVPTQAVGTGGPCAGCGDNSPVIDQLEFHDFHLLGAPNLQGFVVATRNGVAQIVKGLKSYDLHVVNATITGSLNNVTMLAGQALVGAVIPLQREAKQYTLRIAGVYSMTFSVGPPPRPQVEAYSLEWDAVGGGDTFEPLCSDIPGWAAELRRDAEQAQDDLMGMEPFYSIVYEGDRINTAYKTMSQVADDHWVNVGCAGDAVAKVFLTRNTIHTQRPLAHAWEQRQATLKMYVADYCGAGDAFTVPHQRLVWQGDQMTYYLPPRELEARWNEHGATCLNVPRMMRATTPLGPIWFPDIWASLKAVCKTALPPPCMILDAYKYDGAYRVSANP